MSRNRSFVYLSSANGITVAYGPVQDDMVYPMLSEYNASCAGNCATIVCLSPQEGRLFESTGDGGVFSYDTTVRGPSFM